VRQRVHSHLVRRRRRGAAALDRVPRRRLPAPARDVRPVGHKAEVLEEVLADERGDGDGQAALVDDGVELVGDRDGAHRPRVACQDVRDAQHADGALHAVT
jgi:hypothetical protein